MKRNRKKVLVTVSLVLAFIFTCSSLTFFASEAASDVAVSNTFHTDDFMRNFSWENMTVLSTKETSVRTIPTRTYTWTYQNGNFFSDSKTSPCRCHGTTFSCNLNGTCDCVGINGSIQCYAYAQYVFHALTGSYPGSGNTTMRAMNQNTIYTASSLQTLLRSYCLPLFLQVRGPTSNTPDGHSICVIELTSTGIIYCDANGLNRRSNYCLVENEMYISYEGFVSHWNKVIQIGSPNECSQNYSVPSKTANYHQYVCSNCNYNSGQLNHNFVNNTCTVCRQYNTHTSHQLDWERSTSYHWRICKTCNIRLTNAEQHYYGLQNLICECGVRNVSINSTKPPILLN